MEKIEAEELIRLCRDFTVSGEEQTMMETEQDKTEYIRVME